jgi:hypothetical protein
MTMPKLRLDRLVIRLRGVSVADARRAAGALGPALARELREPGATPTTVVGKAPLAERIATPLAARLRGDKR